MSKFNLLRPDKILLTGLKAVGNTLYSLQKSEAKGLAQLTFIGEKKITEVKKDLFSYDSQYCSEQSEFEEFTKLNSTESTKVQWLNFYGLHDVELYEKLGKDIGLDRLTVRQVLDTTQRPKVQEYDEYLFFNIKSVLWKKGINPEIEQLSFVLTERTIISFQEKEGDHFDYIRKKIRENLGLTRKKSADFLLIQLLDSILDNYFESLEEIVKVISDLEKSVITHPSHSKLLKMEEQKRFLRILKSSLIPFKEALSTILNDKTRFIQEGNIKYLRDLISSCSSAIDNIDFTFNSLESLQNIYFANLSQKMNETMKVLTLTATIFIPLTFIAGIYGMNFENMPELKYEYGYYIVWGIMILVMIGMLIFFKVKKWL